jgi:hypothetical protein
MTGSVPNSPTGRGASAARSSSKSSTSQPSKSLSEPLADLGVLPSTATEEERLAARRKHAQYIKDHLRAAEWKETGPDLFFVGVNAVVALFCAALYAFGAMPAIARCGTLAWDWVAQVFVVNWVIMAVGYEGYHRIFYAGGFQLLFGGAKPTKFNPEDYAPGQLARERLFTTLSMGIASLYQCLALHGWAKGWFTATYLDWTAVPLWQFLGTFLLLGLWSDFHFYLCHRLLHTDLLYSHFHKLHHESKNPGPWSGMSMHPVETTLYLSKILGALVIPAHPVHFLFILVRQAGAAASTAAVAAAAVRAGRHLHSLTSQIPTLPTMPHSLARAVQCHADAHPWAQRAPGAAGQ